MIYNLLLSEKYKNIFFVKKLNKNIFLIYSSFNIITYEEFIQFETNSYVDIYIYDPASTE